MRSMHATRIGRRRSAGLSVAVIALALTAAVSGTDRPATAAAVPDCGPTITKSDGTTWRCTFADHFGGRKLNSTHWSAFTTKNTGYIAPECRVDSPDNISVHDGLLHLTIRKEAAPFYCESIVGGFVTQYTGGGVLSAKKFSQTYGRFETRAAFPATQQRGLHGAIWMWPESQRANYGQNSGEIDTAEHWTGTRVVKPALHFRHPPGWTSSDGTTTDDWVTKKCAVSHPEDFHTYAVEWTKETFTFIYDNQICLTVDWEPAAPLTKPQPFDEPFFLTMNVQFADTSRQLVLNDAPLPGTMKIDYVKAWS